MYICIYVYCIVRHKCILIINVMSLLLCYFAKKRSIKNRPNMSI